jgi:polar amino acid transport system substrate-binding protein
MSTFRRTLALVSLTMAAALVAVGCAAGTPSDGGSSAPADDLVVPELQALLPQSVLDKGEILVGTDPSYPPCDFRNDAGEIDGYNNALLQAMAPRLGVKITMEGIAFDGLLPGVESGKFDAAMECITDNLERQEIVQFVDYSYSTKGIIKLTDSAADITTNPLSYCGLHAGVQTGTEFVTDVELFNENCAQAGEAAIETTNFPTTADQNTALQSGQIDFAVTSFATGAWQAAETDDLFEILGSPLLAKTYVGIVVNLDNDDLAKALEGALQAIIDDGTYEEVMSEWKLEELMLPEPGINLASSKPLEIPTPCGACGE